MVIEWDVLGVQFQTQDQVVFYVFLQITWINKQLHRHIT